MVKAIKKDHQSFYAQFANAAYSIEKDPKNQVISGFKLDTDLSTQEQQVWKNGEFLIVSVRGTSKLSDVVSDIFLMLENIQNSARYKSLNKWMEKVKDKYYKKKTPPYTVVCGHSLGGALSIRLTEDFIDDIKECHVYNAGASFDSVRSDLIAFFVCKFTSRPKRCKLREKLFIHKSFGDLLTNHSNFTASNQQWAKPNSINTHSIQNFLRNDKKTAKDLDRMSAKELKQNLRYMELDKTYPLKNRKELITKIKSNFRDEPDTNELTLTEREETKSQTDNIAPEDDRGAVPVESAN